MRAVLTIIKGNLRKGKGAFISIFILMFVLSLSLSAVLTINTNSTRRDAQALKEAGYGDTIACVTDSNVVANGTTVDALYDRIRTGEGVKSVRRVNCIYGSLKELNGHNSSSSIIGMPYGSGSYNFVVFKGEGEGVYKEAPVLSDGEACVPISYQSMYDCKIGDTFKLKVQDGYKEFKVKYYFEDPFMGSSMMGVKTVLFTESDIEKLRAADDGSNETPIQQGTYFDITKTEDAPASALKYAQKLNESTGINNYAWLTMATSQASSYMLILTNIFSGILVAFVLLLLVVAIIVIGHSISSSIEMNYVNIGVLKAIGTSQSYLRLVFILQYGIAAFLGAVAGVPVAIPVVHLVNGMTLSVTGLNVSDQIALAECVVSLGLMLLLIILYVIYKLRKLRKIKPVRALAGGRDEVYFSSRVQLGIHKRGLGFWLAMRQLISNAKQYIGAVIITMLLVFFLIMVSGMSSWMGEDGAALSSFFDCFQTDLDIGYIDDSIQPEVEDKINEISKIETSFHETSRYLNLDNYNMFCFICEKPDQYSTVLQGRTCLYDNEVMVTKFVAKDLELKIGDTVTITTGSHTADYIISGFYQCANDMGSNFAMSEDGYERLVEKELDNYSTLYRIADSDKATQIQEMLTKQYEKNQLKASVSNEFNEIDSIVSAVQGISTLIYIISLVFVFVIIVMQCSKIFVREQTDFGIYKAQGFSTGMLRHQFAIRFAIIAAIGSMLGVVMDFLLSGYMMKLLFSFMGISEAPTNSTLDMYLIPIGFMVIFFYLFAYLLSYKLKKVQPRNLITE